MQLDERLQALADFVPPASRVADIGTDHGYLALALLRDRKATYVVASDVNQGPLEAATHTFLENGVAENEISVRLGDGLKVLKPGEVDCVCIAGMGGVLMTQILEASMDVVDKLKELVLQPMNGAAELRKWLYASDWHIDDETLAVDSGRIYEIIKAVPGKADMPSDVDLLIGPVLWQKKPPLLRHHIETLLFQARCILVGMERSDAAKESPRHAQVEKTAKELEERLKW